MYHIIKAHLRWHGLTGESVCTLASNIHWFLATE